MLPTFQEPVASILAFVILARIRRHGFGPPPPAYTYGQRRTWGR